MSYVDFSDLLGKTITEIRTNHETDELFIDTDDGGKYRMFHGQDCCERVAIEEIVGDLQDLVGNPLLRAEERSNREEENKDHYESATWTFYELATVKGSVTIRWLGESNGYYSESVDFEKL